MVILLSSSDFFDIYYSVFYGTQKYFSSILLSLSMLSNNYLFIFIFFLGIFTVITPCLVSIFPLALSYITYKQNDKLNITVFIIGICTSIMVLILSANSLSFSFLVYKLPLLSYLILIMISLNLMKILNFPSFTKLLSKYFNYTNSNDSLLQSYLMGFVISSSSLPCNTSFILIFTFLLQNTNSAIYMLLYLIIYFMGCVVPLFLLFQLKFNYKVFFMLSYFWKIIFPISGSFLFIFSLFSLLKIVFI